MSIVKKMQEKFDAAARDVNDKDRYQVILFSTSGTPYGSAYVSHETAVLWQNVLRDNAENPTINFTHVDTHEDDFYYRQNIIGTRILKANICVTFPEWRDPFGVSEIENTLEQFASPKLQEPECPKGKLIALNKPKEEPVWH
jgi:hypothetical protein